MAAARGAGRLSGISKFWESLDAQFKEDLLKKNPNSILLLLKDIKGADLLSNFLCSVIDNHYDDNMHTFDFSGHVLGVTLEDVLYLTGLPIQGKPLIYDKSLDEDAFMRVFGEEFKGRTQLKFDEVKNIARDGRRLFNVRKIAVLLVMCEYFICPSNNHHAIISQKVHLVENVDEIDSYALGAALLSYLYHGLEYKKRKKHYIGGNLWIVLGFLLVRIPKIQDMLGINLRNYPPDVTKGAPLLPWIVSEIKSKTHNHWATLDVSVIPSLSDEDIIWTPYEQMACPRPGDLKSVRNLVPLIGYNCLQHHMPHNCSDQFPVFQDYNVRSLTWKPCEIPRFKKLGGGHDRDYKDIYKEQIAEWNAGKPAEAYMSRLQQKNLYDSELVLTTKFLEASLVDTSDIRRSITQRSLCKWKWYLANKKLRHDDIFGIENVNDGGGEKGEHDPRSGRNEERSSMRRPSPSPLPVTSSDPDRANDNFFGIENDNSYLGDKANPRSGRNEERSSMRRPSSPSPLPVTLSDPDRANDNFLEIENDNSQLGDKVDDGGSEKSEQEDPHSGRRNEALLPVQYHVAGPDPRTPNFYRNDSGRRISCRITKGARCTSYYGLTTVLKVQKGQKLKGNEKKKKGKE